MNSQTLLRISEILLKSLMAVVITVSIAFMSLIPQTAVAADGAHRKHSRGEFKGKRTFTKEELSALKKKKRKGAKKHAAVKKKAQKKQKAKVQAKKASKKKAAKKHASKKKAAKKHAAKKKAAKKRVAVKKNNKRRAAKLQTKRNANNRRVVKNRTHQRRVSNHRQKSRHQNNSGDAIANLAVGLIIGSIIEDNSEPVYRSNRHQGHGRPVYGRQPHHDYPRSSTYYRDDYTSNGYGNHVQQPRRQPYVEYERRQTYPRQDYNQPRQFNNTTQVQRPPVEQRNPPKIVTYSETASLEPWTPGWNTYCTRKYRSFNPKSGTFLGYDGDRHFCNAQSQ